jgi:O-antigen/teichoic acid export membrane protein
MSVSGVVKVLGGDIVKYGLMAGLARGSHFLLLPLLTRLFSPAEYGVIDLVATFVALVSTSIVLDLNGALARYFSRSTEEVHGLYSAVFAFVAVWGGVVSITILSLRGPIVETLSIPVGDSEILGLGVAIAFVVALNQVGDMLLRMERRIVLYNLVVMLEGLIFLVMAVVAVAVYGKGLRWVFVSQLVGVCTHLGLLVVVTRSRLFRRPRWASLKRSLGFSLPLVPATLVGWANAQADRIILLALLGAAMVGQYGAAARICGIIGVLLSVFQMAWVPFSMQIVHHDEGVRNAVYSLVLKYFFGGALALALVVSAFAPEITTLVATGDFATGSVVIPWLLGAMVLHQSANVVNVGSLVRERTGINSVAATIGFCLNVGLSIPLVSRYGLAGAAYGLLVGEAAFVSVLYYKTKALGVAAFDTSRIVAMFVIYVAACGTLTLTAPTPGVDFGSLAWRSGLGLGSALLILWVALSGFRTDFRELRQDLGAPQ